MTVLVAVCIVLTIRLVGIMLLMSMLALPQIIAGNFLQALSDSDGRIGRRVAALLRGRSVPERMYKCSLLGADCGHYGSGLHYRLVG